MTTQSFRTSLCADIPIFKIIEDSKNGHKIEEITQKDLYNWFIQKGFWNLKYDVFHNESDDSDETNETNGTQSETDNKIDYKKLYEESQLEIQELKKQLELLKQQNTKIQEKPKQEEKPKIEILDDLEYDLEQMDKLERSQIKIETPKKKKRVVLSDTEEEEDDDDKNKFKSIFKRK